MPIWKMSIAWDFFVLIYIIVDFVMTMMVQCYESYYNVQHILYDYFDRFLIPILLLDILVSLNTVVIKEGKVISSRPGIAHHYFRSVFFWVDISCLIISIAQVIFNDRDNYSTVYNYIIFIKMIKMFEFDKNIKRYGLHSFDALLVY